MVLIGRLAPVEHEQGDQVFKQGPDVDREKRKSVYIAPQTPVLHGNYRIISI